MLYRLDLQYVTHTRTCKPVRDIIAEMDSMAAAYGITRQIRKIEAHRHDIGERQLGYALTDKRDEDFIIARKRTVGILHRRTGSPVDTVVITVLALP